MGETGEVTPCGGEEDKGRGTGDEGHLIRLICARHLPLKGKALGDGRQEKEEELE